jgi:SAM-dependent methyltransferase
VLSLDRSRINRLRAALDAVGFTADAASAALGHAAGAVSRPRERPVLLRRLERADERLAAALALFVLEQPVSVDEIEQLLTPLHADDLIELGIAEAEGDGVRATVRILPHAPLLLASDGARRSDSHDLVTGVTRPTTLLGQLTIRRPVRRALDIGTGNGVLALLCAPHAEHVIATDVNEHALELAAFNAMLNGIENVEFRLGGFLEPVAGERFGLVVSNPPYVVSPETQFLFRDAGLGDGLSEQILRLVPEALEEDGFGCVTISWEASGEDVAARPRSWLAGSGCDAWLLHTTTDDTLTTAAMWNRDLEDDPQRYGEQIDRWVDWYDEQGIEALAYGVCILRRRDGDNWIRAANLPGNALEPASAQLLRLFAAQDFLARSGDLAKQAVRPAPELLVRHSLRSADHGWSAAGTELVLEGGLGFTAALDAPGAALVSGLDGRTLGEVVAAARDDIEVEAAGFDTAALGLARRLIELGFVVPAEGAQATYGR